MRSGSLTNQGFNLSMLVVNIICLPVVRFACDGLKRQRLTAPMLKDKDGNLTPVAWEDALVSVAKMFDSTPSDQIAAVAGGLCDAEVNT